MMYKILDENGRATVSGCRWHLPQGEEPGEWMCPATLPLELCRRGYHLYPDLVSLLGYLDRGLSIYEAEGRGEVLDCGNEMVLQEARLLRRLNWGERVARLFACDCADRALAAWARTGRVDSCSREAVAVARRYAIGKATTAELCAAEYIAEGAAWSVTRSYVSVGTWYNLINPAISAAWSIVWSASNYAAKNSAGNGAEYAAWGAAVNAVDAAVKSNDERSWQAERLRQYLYGEVK